MLFNRQKPRNEPLLYEVPRSVEEETVRRWRDLAAARSSAVAQAPSTTISGATISGSGPSGDAVSSSTISGFTVSGAGGTSEGSRYVIGRFSDEMLGAPVGELRNEEIKYASPKGFAEWGSQRKLGAGDPQFTAPTQASGPTQFSGPASWPNNHWSIDASAGSSFPTAGEEFTLGSSWEKESSPEKPMDNRYNRDNTVFARQAGSHDIELYDVVREEEATQLGLPSYSPPSREAFSAPVVDAGAGGTQRAVSKPLPTATPPQVTLTSDLSLPIEQDLKRRFGANIRSALGPGTVIEGVFRFDSPVCIEGTLTGEVQSSSALIVGAEASVSGTVRVGSLIVLGTVNGTVEAEQLVEIRKGGMLDADIVTKRVAIEDGGWFSGRCSMK